MSIEPKPSPALLSTLNIHSITSSSNPRLVHQENHHHPILEPACRLFILAQIQPPRCLSKR